MVRQSAHHERPRARAKAWAPTADAARRPAGLLLPDGIVDAAGSLRGLLSEWVRAEVAPGRLMPWLPVAFGFGIVAYFSADREPAWWAALVAAIAGVVVTVLARHRPIGSCACAGDDATAAGFATATLQRYASRTRSCSYPLQACWCPVLLRSERSASAAIVSSCASRDCRRAPETRTRARSGRSTQRKRSGCRKVCRIQSAPVAAAATAAAWWRRFCPRYVFSTHRSVRI